MASTGLKGAPVWERYAELSLEELMNIPVMSVSKRDHALNDSAAAVHVLTNEEIRRSGVTSFPDALRLVPGMNVASINSRNWAISARGFNQMYANKLLVLIDGRAVYNPLFSGVFWDLQQPMLEDVDRIEVIRGPGATLWGSNAVNGVVNLISRSADETQGLASSAGGGDVHRRMAGVRYGGRVGETYYRVSSSYYAKDDYLLSDGSAAGDAWSASTAGFRLDRYPSGGGQLTVSGDIVVVDEDRSPVEGHSYNMLARWTQPLVSGGRVEVQSYFDQTERDLAEAGVLVVDTFDASFEHNMDWGHHNTFIWGLGFRHQSIGVTEGSLIEVRPDQNTGSENLHTVSAFLQADLHLVPERVVLTAGTKFEHNDYTGFEFQPSARIRFKLSNSQTLWLAASRAVRTPSAHEGSEGYRLPIPLESLDLPYPTRLVGNPAAKSEVLWAYELGYRIQPHRKVTLDVAAFYNEYDRLLQFAPEHGRLVPGSPLPSIDIPVANVVAGDTYGGELILAYAPQDNIRFSLGYALFFADLVGWAGAEPDYYSQSTPRHQVTFRSAIDVTRSLSIDLGLRHVGRVDYAPAYVTADLRLAYRPMDQLEVSLVGQNLFARQHAERSFDFLTVPAEVPRGVYMKVSWGF